MSIFSKFLKRSLGVPEIKIDINNLPIAETFMAQLIHSGASKIFAPLKDFDLEFLKVLIDGELNRRNPKKAQSDSLIEVKTTAGIGRAPLD